MATVFSKLDWHYVATVSTLVGSEDAQIQAPSPYQAGISLTGQPLLRVGARGLVRETRLG